jgi:uncharacterized protein YaaQ
MDNQIDVIQQLKARSRQKVEDLMTIVIQEKDQAVVTELLEEAGYTSTHIASTGGFLGRKNATLLVGIPTGKKAEFRSILEKATMKDIAIETGSEIEGTNQITEGATIFSLAIERHEEV